MTHPAKLETFLADIAAQLGAEAIGRAAETLARYGETTTPAGPKPPSAVLWPGSTGDVQTIIRLANRNAVPLWPISTGNNQGLGTRSPVADGMVTVDLGRRMNKILEIDDTLAFAVVEPGVSYQALHDELVRRGNRLMIDTTSGPPQGGPLGNALDKGTGYTPYFDHFGMSCGMEVVLGSGEVIRTGDGGLANSQTWHVSKYSYGPSLDGLFVQSNFGIVTRMGVWLMPRPPAIRSVHFSFAEDDDLEEIIELIRPLKLSNFVPTLFRVANDMYLIAPEERHPEYQATGGRVALSDAARAKLQAKHGIGSWVASAAFYGPSDAAIEPQIERVKAHFTRSGKGRSISHDEALANPSLKTAIDSFSGIPTAQELGMLTWRPGGGNTWFLPGTPMIGKTANAHQHMARKIMAEHGLDYVCNYVCGARFARGLHVLIFNREDAAENQRGDAAYRALTRSFADQGFSVGRAPIDYHALHMAEFAPELRDTCNRIKDVLDPSRIIAPGKYGIG